MKTSDLYLAAALDTAGQTPAAVTQDGRRAVFVFEDSEEVHATAEAFFARRLPLDASSYAERIRQAKGRVMSVREGRITA